MKVSVNQYRASFDIVKLLYDKGTETGWIAVTTSCPIYVIAFLIDKWYPSEGTKDKLKSLIEFYQIKEIDYD